MASNNSLNKKWGVLIAERDFGWMCAYCYRILDPVVRYERLDYESGVYFKPIQHPDMPCVDHVVPMARGGPTILENLVLSCKTCNSRKGTKLPGEF